MLYRCSIFFSQMNYITDVFLDRAIIKNVQDIFCCSLRHSPPKVMRLFSDFFLCSHVTFVIYYLCLNLYFLCNPFFMGSHWRCSVKKSFLKNSANFTMELFCENSEPLLAVNYFRKKVSSQMFDWVLNTLPHPRLFGRN